MKVLNLQCALGHGFEGWFASSADFDTQMAGSLVSCPLCGDSTITKLLTAPRLNLGNPKPPAEPAPAAADVQAQTPPPTQEPPAAQTELEGRWLRAVREVMAKTEDVGTRFAEEARKMHYGDIEERGIRGKATAEQARELVEEGIAVFSLTVPPALKETLQ